MPNFNKFLDLSRKAKKRDDKNAILYLCSRLPDKTARDALEFIKTLDRVVRVVIHRKGEVDVTGFKQNLVQHKTFTI